MLRLVTVVALLFATTNAQDDGPTIETTSQGGLVLTVTSGQDVQVVVRSGDAGPTRTLSVLEQQDRLDALEVALSSALAAISQLQIADVAIKEKLKTDDAAEEDEAAVAAQNLADVKAYAEDLASAVRELEVKPERCKGFKVQNGVVDEPVELLFGVHATISCNAGFFLGGERDLQCSSEGEWLPAQASAKCVACDADVPNCVACTDETGVCTACKPLWDLTSEGKCTPAIYGLSAKNPGASCKDILTKGGSKLKSRFGYFLADVDGSTTTTLQVYCDMETDGGGWLGVAHVVNGNNEFEHASNVHNSLQEVWPPQPDLAGMSAWESGLGKLISGTTIGAFAKRAKTASGYTYKDVRFRCTDASTDGVTLDIKSTRANVFEWFTGSTDTRPDACDSETLPDDRSKLGQLCQIWGSTYSAFDVPKVTSKTQTWGIQISDGPLHNPVPDNRLYQFPMFILGSPPELRALLPVGGRGAHFAIDGQQNRFECDNYPGGGSSLGDEWMIFVR